MVVDGVREMVGSKREQILAALREVHPDAIAPVSLAADYRSVTVGAGRGQGEVLLVRFAQSRTTQVAGGENAHRTLNDANAVEKLTSLDSWSGSAISFSIDPPKDGEGIAVLVQASGGRMLGAAAR